MQTSLKVFYGLIALGLAAYLGVLAQFYFKTDTAILSHFAERMLSGEKMSQAYYEVNPPLSMIVYIPQILLKNITGLPVYYAHTLYICLLALLSAVLSWSILKRLTVGDEDTKRFLFGLAVISFFMIPNFSFGDREHLIILGLLPFTLIQIALHQRIEIPRKILLPGLIFGAIVVLIKPHYGLLPTALMIWRFWKHKDGHFLQAPDFLALSIGVLSYGVLLWFVFTDYLRIILPDVLSLYVSFRNPAVYPEIFVFACAALVIGLTALSLNLETQAKRIIQWLMIVTCLLFIPYLVQGKGFDYHRIPWLFSFFTLIGFSAFATLRIKLRPVISTIIATMIVIAGIWFLRPLPLERPSHDEFKTLAFSQLVERECPKPCSFLLLNDTSDFIHQLVIYHDATHASRFTSMWYLLPLIEHEKAIRDGTQSAMEDGQYRILKKKYADMVARDLERYEPDIILKLENLNVGDPEFDFIEFYSSNQNFDAAFAAYEKTDTVTIDQRPYFAGLKTKYDGKDSMFTVYKRRN